MTFLTKRYAQRRPEYANQLVATYCSSGDSRQGDEYHLALACCHAQSCLSKNAMKLHEKALTLTSCINRQQHKEDGEEGDQVLESYFNHAPDFTLARTRL